MGDLNTLLAFEQELITAERPFEPALKAGNIHYYAIKNMVQADHTYLAVALVENEIIGSGYARMEKSKPFQKFDYYAYIGFIYVKPTHRGKGVSQKILDALVLWAKSKKLEEIRLDVYHANLPAIRAYEKAGFKKHVVKMRLDVNDKTT